VAGDYSVFVETPDGDEFVVETWKPHWFDGAGLLDSLGLGLVPAPRRKRDSGSNRSPRPSARADGSR
jgi:hypothetical protein